MYQTIYRIGLPLGGFLSLSVAAAGGGVGLVLLVTGYLVGLIGVLQPDSSGLPSASSYSVSRSRSVSLSSVPL